MRLRPFVHKVVGHVMAAERSCLISSQAGKGRPDTALHTKHEAKTRIALKGNSRANI